MVLMRGLVGWKPFGRFPPMLASILMLLNTGCSLLTPGCGNRVVRESIERDARTSIEAQSSMESASQIVPADVALSVTGTYETSRTENTRACSAAIKVGDKKNELEIPIEYEVIKSDDGQLMYRWNGSDFGKRVIATVLMSGLSHMKPEPREQPAEVDPETEKSASPSDQEPPAIVPSTSLEEWKASVSKTIRNKVLELTDMPAGTQVVSFTVSGDGLVGGARSVGPGQDTELAKKTIAFFNKIGAVERPLDGHLSRVTIKLTFR